MAVLKVRNSNGKASLGGAKDYLERDGRNVECSTFNIDRLMNGRKICNSQRSFMTKPREGNIIG